LVKVKCVQAITAAFAALALSEKVQNFVYHHHVAVHRVKANIKTVKVNVSAFVATAEALMVFAASRTHVSLDAMNTKTLMVAVSVSLALRAHNVAIA
jgi:hypothetical protein